MTKGTASGGPRGGNGAGGRPAEAIGATTFTDHRDHPRRVGEVEAADVVAEAGSHRPGHSIRVTGRLDPSGRFVDLAYRTDARGATLAACSLFAELAIGRTLRETLALSRVAVLARLGQLPDDDADPPLLVQDALLRTPVRPPRQKPQIVPDHELVCWCFHVTAGELRAAIAERGLHTLEQVRESTRANTGCGSCRPEIEAILAEASAPGGPHLNR